MSMFIHSRAVAMRVTSLVFLIGIVFISFFFLKINFWLGSFFFVFFAGIAIWMWLLAATVTSKPLPDPAKWAGPNTIPLKTRIFNLLISGCLVAYALYSIASNDFYLPSKREPGTHVHGLVVWIFVAACLAVVINMMSTVVDHYDKRNNELTYAHIDAATQWLGWIFFLIRLTSIFAFNSNNLGCEEREVHRVRNPDNALAAVTFVRYCENKS